jgi:hypothetical protein
MMKATMAHNNYRADPDLQKSAERVIAVRRIACACEGCRAALRRPAGQRYAKHDDCARFAIFGRTNDWKLVTLQLGKSDEDERIAGENHELQIQARAGLDPGWSVRAHTPHPAITPSRRNALTTGSRPPAWVTT